MTRRTAQTREDSPAFVDADPLPPSRAKPAAPRSRAGSPPGSVIDAAAPPRTRSRKPRATPLDPTPNSGGFAAVEVADDPDERPTAPRQRARPKPRAAVEGEDATPRRASKRGRAVDAEASAPRSNSGSNPVVAPAMSLPQDDDPSDVHSRLVPSSRALVPAHRVTRKETALVSRQTQQIAGLGQTATTKAVTVVGPGGHETTVLPAPKRPLATIALPVFAPARTRDRKRHPLGVVLFVIAAAAVLAGGLYTVSPLSPIHNRQSTFSPSAALLALNPESRTPGGPWDTSAGTAAALGQGGGAGPGVSAPGSAGLPVSGGSGSWDFSDSPGAVFISAAPVSPWPPGDPYMAVPGHPAFRVGGAGGFYPGAYGQCTWWAAFQRRDENLSYLGDARFWAYGAAARGYRVGVKAAAGATVVFRGGAQGAGGAGHVAHVEAVYPGGWFLISEMNFYWNGGGWGRVDYRFAHEGWGVAFIY